MHESRFWKGRPGKVMVGSGARQAARSGRVIVAALRQWMGKLPGAVCLGSDLERRRDGWGCWPDERTMAPYGVEGRGSGPARLVAEI